MEDNTMNIPNQPEGMTPETEAPESTTEGTMQTPEPTGETSPLGDMGMPASEKAEAEIPQEPLDLSGE